MSKGHIEFIGNWEYFLGADNCLYRADRTNPIDIWGYRQGARFECYAHSIEMCLKLARG